MEGRVSRNRVSDNMKEFEELLNFAVNLQNKAAEIPEVDCHCTTTSSPGKLEITFADGTTAVGDCPFCEGTLKSPDYEAVNKMAWEELNGIDGSLGPWPLD